MKKYNITYDSKGNLSTPVPLDEFYVAQAENEAVAIEATFPANVIGTVRAYIEYPGGGTITECGVLSVNNHIATLVLSSDNLRYHFVKVGFEVINGTREMRYEPVTLEVDRFVNPIGSPSPSPYTVTVKIGNVTELEPGEAPTVNNVGTEKNIVLDFGIPKGDKGDKGDTGNDGYTPIKGVDYYTDEEVNKIKAEIEERIKNYTFDYYVEVDFDMFESDLDNYTEEGIYLIRVPGYGDVGMECYILSVFPYWDYVVDDSGEEILENMIQQTLFDLGNGLIKKRPNIGQEWKKISVSQADLNNAIGDVETSLENIIKKYGLGGEGI